MSSEALVPSVDGTSLHTVEFRSLAGRLQDGFDAQDRRLSKAQGQTRSQEEKIEALQAEVRWLAAQVLEKEDQVAKDGATLAALKAQHADLNSKNQSITDTERRAAGQREEIREEYVLHLRESTQELHTHWRALTGDPPAEANVVDELIQMIRELEASIDALASEPDKDAMLTAGNERQVFDCLSKVFGALCARIRVIAAAPCGADEAAQA